MEPLELLITWFGAWYFVHYARRLPPNFSKRSPRQPLQCITRYRCYTLDVCYTLQIGYS